MEGQSILVSSPGKVIIHGEHAVVYGKKALACSLDVRTFLKVRLGTENKVKVSLPDIEVERSWELSDLHAHLELPICDACCPVPACPRLLERLKCVAGVPDDSPDTRHLALIAFLYLYAGITHDSSTGRLPSAEVTIRSALPPGAGLGSSAAYSTCLAASLLHLRGLIVTPPNTGDQAQVTWSPSHLELINSWAYQSERILHGNPSGIDNSVSVYGGGLVFQEGRITPLTSIPNLRILLVNTKVARSTKAMVARVREKLEKFPSVVRPVLDSIEAITDTSLQLLQQVGEKNGEPASDHFHQLGELVSMNQKHLDFLGVSHHSISSICKVAAKHGLSAKLTGAGGGGCVFVLLHSDTPSDTVCGLQRDLESRGFSVWETTLGGSGVLRHLATHGQTYTIPQELL